MDDPSDKPGIVGEAHSDFPPLRTDSHVHAVAYGSSAYSKGMEVEERERPEKIRKLWSLFAETHNDQDRIEILRALRDNGVMFKPDILKRIESPRGGAHRSRAHRGRAHRSRAHRSRTKKRRSR